MGSCPDPADNLERKRTMGDFENKVIVITGAGQGAGKQLALRFYQEGACVCLLDLNGENLKAVMEEVQPDQTRSASL